MVNTFVENLAEILSLRNGATKITTFRHSTTLMFYQYTYEMLYVRIKNKTKLIHS